jgi:hypothetical protein
LGGSLAQAGIAVINRVAITDTVTARKVEAIELSNETGVMIFTRADHKVIVAAQSRHDKIKQ